MTYNAAGALDELRAVDVLVSFYGIDVLDDALGAIVAGSGPARAMNLSV